MNRPALRLTLWAGAAGVALTLLTFVAPFVRFGYRSPEARIALDAAEAVIALVAAYLVFGRLRERRLRRDAAIGFALAVFAGVNVLTSLVPAAAAGPRTQIVWSALFGRLIGAIAWTYGALAGRASMRASKRLPVLVGLAGVATTVVVTAATFTFGAGLPVGVRAIAAVDPSRPLRLEGHPVLLFAQLLLVLLFAVASMRFTTDGDRTGDVLLRWLGAGSALASLARLNYFLFPTIYSNFFYTGDVLRVGFYAMLLIGASAEIRSYWRRLEEDAVRRDELVSQLEELSLVDPLTGLGNRRVLYAVGGQELKVREREGTQVSAVFIDVNEMKTINDRFGHQAGDDALRELAAMLEASFRRSDLIARIGGDEFCVLALSGRPEPAVERLRARLAEREATTDAPYPLSVSIGIALFDPTAHRTLEDLMSDADARMYREKQMTR